MLGAGVKIEIDEVTGNISIGPIPRVERTHKGKSQLAFSDDYVVMDLETTGLDPRFDEIIEIGAIKYHDDIEIDRFQSLVKPENKINSYTTELTGITDEMVQGAPDIDSVLPVFLSFVGDHLIVGHNVNFDVNFIYDSAEWLKLPPFSNDFIDTLRIGRRLYKDIRKHDLLTLVSYLGIGDTVEHRALSDCISTHQCYMKMKSYAAQIGGIPDAYWEHYNALSKMITPKTTDFKPDSPIYGMAFAFTGKLDGMTRKEAMQKVANAGGICCDGVTAATNYLVLGNNDYCKAIKGGKSAKQKKAEKMQLAGADIQTISEAVFCDMLNS